MLHTYLTEHLGSLSLADFTWWVFSSCIADQCLEFRVYLALFDAAAHSTEKIPETLIMPCFVVILMVASVVLFSFDS